MGSIKRGPRGDKTGGLVVQGTEDPAPVSWTGSGDDRGDRNSVSTIGVFPFPSRIFASTRVVGAGSLITIPLIGGLALSTGTTLEELAAVCRGGQSKQFEAFHHG